MRPRVRWTGMVLVVAVLALVTMAFAEVCAQSVASAPRPGVMTPARAQPPPEPPLPQGREFVAADGDRVVLPFDARVQTVMRYEGQVRVVTDPTRMVLVVLLDAQSDRRAPDGIVDFRFRFTLDAPFPIVDTWEGPATIDDARPTPARRGGFSLRGAGRAIDVMSGFVDAAVTEAADGVIRVVSRKSGAGMEWASFDAAEAAAFADAPARMPPPSVSAGAAPHSPASPVGGAALVMSAPGESPTGMVGSILGRVPDEAPASQRPGPTSGPLRVGNAIRSPTKLVDVRPVMPEIAQQANVRGVVIVELTVDPAGNVAGARVLRSIPLLDAAALEAVKQWKYAPTVFNGVPVSLVITATVNFP